MRLNLMSVLQGDKTELPFCFEQDLSRLDIRGQTPFSGPVKVKGRITKSFGQNSVLNLSMAVSAPCQCVCDRCGAPVSKILSAPFSAFVSEAPGDMDSEDTVFLNGRILDLEPLVISAAVLEYPAKILCKKDCKGLCPRCGVDLNQDVCECGASGTGNS